MSVMQNNNKSELREALFFLKPYFKRSLFFSLFTNLLVMAPTLYMLDVYDRVVNSRSEMTLAMETLLVIGAFIVLEVLEWVRTGILQQAGLQFDKRVNERIFDAVFEANLRRIPGASGRATAQ